MNNTETYEFGKNIRYNLWQLWSLIDRQIKEKFSNLNGKTGKYDVPDTLFQKRTNRSNRVLLRWKTIIKNKITLDQLKTFYGGVCVEFVNEDYFDEKNQKLELFQYLKSRIGSDDKISAILSFRNEDGDSGATIARQSFEKFKKLPEQNFTPIKRKSNIHISGKGDNSVWEGNLFYSIKGGSQHSFESHQNIKDPTLFNPAVEYANEIVCLDIDLTMSYFAIHCFDLNQKAIKGFDLLKLNLEKYLKTRNYDEGNLLDYCINHPCLKFGKGFLIDPIQMVQMSIDDFKTSGLENSSVVCHNEAANKYNFYFDSKQKCILTPARPTNFFGPNTFQT